MPEDRDDYEHDEVDESTVHHVDAIDLRSLGVVAGLFYLTAFLVLAFAVAAVWLLAAGLGLISQVEEFMRSIGFRGFRLVGPEVILGFVLILGALVVFLTVMTLVAAAFYNLLGTGRRGVRIRTSVVHPDSTDLGSADLGSADLEPGAEEAASPAVIEPAIEGEATTNAADASDREGDEGEERPAAAAG